VKLSLAMQLLSDRARKVQLVWKPIRGQEELLKNERLKP
jgi:hypothetical protein